MELRHLKYFVAVAEHRHFGRAAEHLHISQPPLSQQVRQLERELGTELLSRTTRRVDLTEAGRAFYTDAVAILADLDAARARVRALAQGWSGLLRVGFTGSASYRQLPQVARLKQTYLPDVELQMSSEMLTPTQERALVEQRLDVGLLRPPVQMPGLTTRTLAVEPLVLAVPAGHRLAGAAALGIADLAGEVLLTYPGGAGSVVGGAVESALRQTGTRVARTHEVEQTSSMVALVAAGLGVALVPDSVRALTLEGVRYREIAGAGTVELALAWREDDASPVVARFVRMLGDHLGPSRPKEADALTTAVA
ncbi:LysR family transcriptional regulator [Georgenia sp. SYP-B2076]|uniref:LysR family transcriptional regulator n=1 Tax=Georgenia sp. SYP-B2076 TaxID=2495881 RepID=UPI000F8ECBDE|nr:LysR family transcriptional regulator [Georgenia sp. SYP-B2076]